MTPRDDTRPEMPHPHDDIHQPPPVGGSWGRLYVVLLLWLAAQIVLYYLFTRAFS